MPFIPFDGAAGSPGQLVGTYQYKVNSTTGGLELWKGQEKIAEQNADGSWFKTSVSTGVGSLHLGGGESSDPAHSVSSAGQNVVFKNEAFNATAGAAMVWFPAGWQGLSADLNTVKTPTYLQFGERDSTVQPNGNAAAGGIPYSFTTTITSNIAVSSVQVQLDESYTGKVRNIIKSQKGVELHSSSITLDGVLAGSVITIEYPSLYFARAGDVLILQIEKEDGSFLRCRRGTSNTSLPWRRLTVRPFIDINVGNVHVGDIKDFYGTNDHNGWVFMDGRSVNALTATQRAAAATLGLTSTIPDARDRLGYGAGGAYGRGFTAGSLKIARSALPNVALAGVTANGSEHSHGAGNLSATVNGSSHNHEIFGVTQITGTFRYDGTGASGNVGNSTTSRNVTIGLDGTHTHTIAGATANESSHTHNFTTDSMNGNVTQTDHLPPVICFGKFIYLGL